MALPTGIRRLRAYGSARNARYCYTRVTGIDATGIEADIEVLDQHGDGADSTVQGLRLDATSRADQPRPGVGRAVADRRVAAASVARPTPDRRRAHGFSSATPTVTPLAAELSDALEGLGAHCTTIETARRRGLRDQLRGDLTGVVVVTRAGPTAPPTGRPCDEAVSTCSTLVHITRELVESSGDSPRLYVVTRGAQAVLDGERPNLEQAGAAWPDQGDRQRASGSRRDPHRRRRCRRGRRARWPTNCSSGPTRTRPHGGTAQWYTARLRPRPLRPDERHDRGRRPRARRGAPAHSHSR